MPVSAGPSPEAASARSRGKRAHATRTPTASAVTSSAPATTAGAARRPRVVSADSHGQVGLAAVATSGLSRGTTLSTTLTV